MELVAGVVAGLLGAIVAAVVIAIILSPRLRRLDQAIGDADRRVTDSVGAVRSDLSGFNVTLSAVRSDLTSVTTASQEALLKVTQDLAKMSETANSLRQETAKLGKLEEAFRLPGPRGGIGELLLENHLRDVLRAGQYELQHSFKDGRRVDAVVTFADKLVPIDSKFPVTAFEELVAASDEDRPKARREFLKSARTHVDAVATYIRPAEGTVDYALMYVPAENVYHQLLVQERGEDPNSAVTHYARGRNVALVSPNTLYLYLQTIALALQGFAIERNARAIGEQMRGFAVDFGRILEEYTVLGKHLTSARGKYEDLNRSADRFAEKLAAAAEGLVEAERPQG